MLDAQTIQTLKHILSQFPQLQDTRVFLFGSRVTDKNMPFSDIDLGIEAHTPVAGHVLIELEDRFEHSDIPFTVDVVDFHHVSDQFRKHALQNIISLN